MRIRKKAIGTMSPLDWIYFCIYCLIQRTPERRAADVWPSLFITLSVMSHVTMVDWLISMATGTSMSQLIVSKGIYIAVTVGLGALLIWHYLFRGNHARIVRERRDDPRQAHCARIGFMLSVEAIGFPFLVVGLLIVGSYALDG